MKQLLNLVALLFFVHMANAQTTERLQLNAGNFVAQKEPLNMFTYTFVRQFGISYAHQVNNRLFVRSAYMEWFNIQNIGSRFKYDGYFEPFKRPQDRHLGDIDSREDYRSIDLSVQYQLLQSKKHELYAGAGISYTWGWYLEYTSISKFPGYPDWEFLLEARRHRDLGLVTEFGYNYMIGKSRVNIGLSETARVYTNMPFVFYTNINIGYNFNWGFMKKKAK